MTSVRAFLLAGLGLALVIAAGLSALASTEPDGLESAVVRTQCEGAADPGACLDELAGEPVLAAAPWPLEGYEVTWLSGLAGVALTFAAGAGLLALARAGRRRSSTAARG